MSEIQIVHEEEQELKLQEQEFYSDDEAYQEWLAEQEDQQPQQPQPQFGEKFILHPILRVMCHSGDLDIVMDESEIPQEFRCIPAAPAVSEDDAVSEDEVDAAYEQFLSAPAASAVASDAAPASASAASSALADNVRFDHDGDVVM